MNELYKVCLAHAVHLYGISATTSMDVSEVSTWINEIALALYKQAIQPGTPEDWKPKSAK